MHSKVQPMQALLLRRCCSAPGDGSGSACRAARAVRSPSGGSQENQRRFFSERDNLGFAFFGGPNGICGNPGREPNQDFSL